MRHDEEGGEAGQDGGPTQRDLDGDQHHQPRGEAPGQRSVRPAPDGDRRPRDQPGDDDAHRAMRELDGLRAGGRGGEQLAVHQREVGVREPRTLARDPRPQQHLAEDRERRDGEQQRRAAGCAGGGRHRSVGGPFADEDDGREDHERHAEVRGDEGRRESLEDDGGAQDRLHDDEGARDDRGHEQRAVATAGAEDGDEADGADERADEDRGGQPMRVLDPGVEVGRREPVTKAERPVRAAEARIGGAHQPAHDDEHVRGDGGGDRQLGKSGQISGFPSPAGERRGLTVTSACASAAMIVGSRGGYHRPRWVPRAAFST